jgi:hypothetical protein
MIQWGWLERGAGAGLSRIVQGVLAVAVVAIASGERSAHAQTQTPGQDEVVIRLGQQQVSVRELTHQLAYQPNSVLDTVKREPNAARVFAVRWFHQMLFAEAAKADGLLARSPGLEGAANELARRRIAEAYVQDIKSQYQPTEAELTMYYKLHGATCNVPGRHRIARVGVLVGRHATPKEVEAGQERINEIERRLKAGEDFAAVVASASDMPAHGPGGELGWVTDEELTKEIGGEAFRQLPVGGVTAIVRTPRGFEIFKLLEREEAKTKTPEECRPEITAALSDQFDKAVAEGRADELAQRFGATMNLDGFLAAIAATQPKQASE